MRLRPLISLGRLGIALALLGAGCAPRGPEVRSFVLRLQSGQDLTTPPS